MKQQSDLILLLAEAYKRLSERSPKFFRVMGMVNLVLALSAGIPSLLIELDIILTPHWAVVVLRIATFAGIWGKVMNMLPVAKPADLPFTEKKQIEQAIKAQSS